IKPLAGMEGEFRLRVGDYRIRYTVDHGRLIVTVIDAGNRGDVYKS
ncbi:MAG: type II toxin-antitoxin system RelE/ParE family toxin, partial [Clostridia bacterium]|nr:type II toxin-antitoxin system RelE/ParE family toxin [Clostridia bacterium]